MEIKTTYAGFETHMEKRETRKRLEICFEVRR